MATDIDMGLVRHYRAEDRTAVYRIAGNTAFFGAPIEAFLDDRRPYLDLFVSYYVDHESDYIWVAVVEDQVVGYLLGCQDTSRQEHTMWRRMLPRVLLRGLLGRYRLGRKTWRYMMRMARVAVRGEYPSADPATYPAHLHINVSEAARGRGFGRRLLTSYLSQLRAEDVPGVHLHTSTHNRAAVHLYGSLGFEILVARPTRLWEGLVAEPVQNLLMGLALSSD